MRGPKRVNSKYSNSGVNPLCPETFPQQKQFQGVRRFDNIKSRRGLTSDVQNPQSRLFLEFKERRIRPETQRYNKWAHDKQEHDFRFKEVLPFGGIIKKGNGIGRQARDEFDKRHGEELKANLFNVETPWGANKGKVGGLIPGASGEAE